MTWAEACNDKRLQNLPYKIEINRQGKLILSPTGNKHAIYQSNIIPLFYDQREGGNVICECAIDTSEGTYVADVTWASNGRFKIIEDELSSSVAPEICIEVWSPSNTPEEIAMKRRLYLERGAEEFWYCDAEGNITQFDRSGELAQSRLCPQFPKQVA